MWAAYDDPDDFRQRIQWEKKLYAKNSRKLLLALRRALLTLHDVSDSDGVVFSDDEIDVQTALMRFRCWKELFRDPPLPWNQITYRTGDRRTSWMEDWIDRQLEDLDRQLDEPDIETLILLLATYSAYMWDRFRLDWFVFRMRNRQ